MSETYEDQLSRVTLMSEGDPTWDLSPNDLAALNAVLQRLDRLEEVLTDIPAIHQRKCHDCKKTHWHADSRTPWVCCPECKSQDTRKVNDPS